MGVGVFDQPFLPGLLVRGKVEIARLAYKTGMGLCPVILKGRKAIFFGI